jgi:hypothetical protein
MRFLVDIVEPNSPSPESELVYVGEVVVEQSAGTLWPTLVFRGTRADGGRLNYVLPSPGRWTVRIPLDGGPWKWEPDLG